MWSILSNRYTSILGLVCYLTVGLYLLNVFHPLPWIEVLYSFLAAILLISAIPTVRKSNQWITVILLGSGFFLFYRESTNIDIVITGFGSNINLLSLFLLVPLLAVFITTAGYLNILKIKIMSIQLKKEAHPYRLSFLLTSGMGAILNLGSMAIIYRIAEGSFTKYHKKKLVMVILRAFGFCMFWSPYFVNVGLVLVLFDVHWITMGWLGFIIALIYLLVTILFFPITRFKNDDFEEKSISKDAVDEKISLVPLVIFASLLIAVSLTLDFVLSVNMLTVVSLVGFFYPLLYAWFTKVGKEYIQEMYEYMKTSFERIKNEIVVFVSAGFFGAAIAQTDIGVVVSNSIYELSSGSIFIMSIIIILFAIALAMFGIHPVVIVIGIGSSLSPDLFNVSATYMALLLLVAWTLATQLSPFSGSVLMASGLSNQSPWEIVRQNVFFVLSLAFLLSIALYIFYLMGLV